tara:strand:+ start:2035 stop:2484 length:450 start_codon:yes stop_codon:yes gene_type:complete
MPQLLGIAVVPKIMGEIFQRDSVIVDTKTGIEGDARGSKKRRQITILFEDDWKKVCKDLNSNLHWTTRRANLLVSGINGPQEENSIIKIGNIKLKINFETDPCNVMEKQKSGLKKALTPDWRGGVCCSVIQGGKISIGDSVIIEKLNST